MCLLKRRLLQFRQKLISQKDYVFFFFKETEKNWYLFFYYSHIYIFMHL